MITFILMLLLNVVLPRFMVHFFREEKWNVGKEILWTLVNVSIIGFGNFAFFQVAYSQPFSLSMLFWFQGITLAVGVWPISLMVLVKENRERHKFVGEAASLNQQMIVQEDVGPAGIPEVHLSSPAGTEQLDISLAQFLFAQAADNYVDVFYLENQVAKKRTLRTTLKAVGVNLEAHPHFFRCHKSYLVNLHQVIRVSGNAQGYKLHLKDSDALIPVSRQHNEVLRQRLSAHQ